MITSEQDFLQFLAEHGFSFQRFEHPAVFTCAEAELFRPSLPAAGTKNLFLCDKKGRRFFLIVTSCEKTLKLERLSSLLGVSHLRFASESNLVRLLGVSRGSVTMMGLANDTENKVELWIDSEIWRSGHFLTHPLVNTATLILSKDELLRFFGLSGHPPHFFEEKDGI